MLRVLLLVAVASMASAQTFSFNQIQTSYEFGTIGSYAPYSYCHSYCTFSGEYEFMRLWEDADPDFLDDTQIFDWSYDGGLNFWNDGRGCEDTIDFYRYVSANPTGPSRDALKACKPEWIYIEQVAIEYVRSQGVFHWTHHIEDAYQPTDDAWNEWADVAFEAQFGMLDFSARGGPYDSFDGLLRYFPDADGQTITGQFEDDLWFRESYIANYEPNFCSMQMPFTVTEAEAWCNGNIIDDSDNVDYPTADYCISAGLWNVGDDVQYRWGCASEEDDDCDSLNFPSAKRSVRELRMTPTKSQKLLRATRNPVQVAKRDKRATDIFYSQDQTAGIQFPYCALRD